MLASTEGIVLHFIKYSESSVIATIYTREFGRQSFMINAVRGKKSRNKISLLQPLFLVDLVTYQKETREIQRVKEIRIQQAYQNIPFDIAKSTQAIFLAEMLCKTIGEEESFPDMFEFIQHSLLYFDLMAESAPNFHLWFLLRLTEYLGFLPETSPKGFEGWFDLRKGTVVPFEPAHPMFINKEATPFLQTLLTLKIGELANLAVSRNIRDYLLQKIVDYYQLHFDNLGKIKSLDVLKQVFS